MKKAYVKPVMESEAFVANEYVAACYWAKCDPQGIQDLGRKHESCKGHSARVGDTKPQLGGALDYGAVLVGNNWCNIEINGISTLHPVEVTNHAEIHPGHPNSSV